MPNFKRNARIIPEKRALFHLMHQPCRRHKVLYAGNNLTLLSSLNDAPVNFYVVRCPDAATGRTILKSKIGYALLLLDAELPDATGAALALFARALAHREGTPVVFINRSEECGRVLEAVRRRVDT